MNLLNDDIEYIAERIKLRVMADRAPNAIYVDQQGRVRMDRAHEPRRRIPLSASDLLAVYSAKAKCEEIEDDLAFKLKELRH